MPVDIPTLIVECQDKLAKATDIVIVIMNFSFLWVECRWNNNGGFKRAVFQIVSDIILSIVSLRKVSMIVIRNIVR